MKKTPKDELRERARALRLYGLLSNWASIG